MSCVEKIRDKLESLILIWKSSSYLTNTILILNFITTFIWFESKLFGNFSQGIAMIGLCFCVFWNFTVIKFDDSLGELHQLFNITKPSLTDILVTISGAIIGIAGNIYIARYVKGLIDVENMARHSMLFVGLGLVEGIALALIVVLIAPLFEELLFRHMIQKVTFQMRLSAPIPISILTTSFLFALAHIFAYGLGIEVIPVLSGIFVVGLTLGIAYQITENLAVPILIHTSNNFLALLLYFL